jgi:hypothetical protein
MPVDVDAGTPGGIPGASDNDALSWRSGLTGTDLDQFVDLDFAGDLAYRRSRSMFFVQCECMLRRTTLNITSMLCRPLNARAAMADVPERMRYKFSTVVRDGAIELMRTGCSKTVAGQETKILDVPCKAHGNIRIDKESGHIANPAGKTKAHDILNSVDANNLIPSLAARSLQIALEHMRTDPLFYNKHGAPVFADNMGTYFNSTHNRNGGITTRVGANLLYGPGGMPATNNAVESSNKTEHGNLHFRRPIQTHLPRIMASQGLLSKTQKDFSDDVRSDVFHQDMWIFARCIMDFMPYLGWDDIRYNVLDSAIEVLLPVERLSAACLQCLDSDEGMARQIDFATDLTTEQELAMLVPTFHTVAWAVAEQQPQEKHGKLHNAIKSAAELRDFLLRPCSDGRGSWVQQLVDLFERGSEVLRDADWSYWEQLHTAFAVLLPLRGETVIRTYLQRLERGLRTHASLSLVCVYVALYAPMTP